MRLRDRPLVWLLRKEWRELLVSRAWWLLLLLMGPLTGVTFVQAARVYAEMSGEAAAGEALSPLIGIWAPTFSACELAAVFLLPFVAIRIGGADRQTGAAKLEAQGPLPSIARIAAKAAVGLTGWLVAMLPAALAVALWTSAGGHLYPPELTAVVLGHILHAALTIALGIAAATVTTHPSTAAVVTLGVTVGTWIVHFFAAVQGGWWERVAAFTPSAIIADFQHGLIRLDTLATALVLVLAALGVACIWQRHGIPVSRRWSETTLLSLLAALAIAAASHAHPTWDLSENRYNSFPIADERALRNIRGTLRIDAHLAPEDPRRADLEHRAFSKLRRAVPNFIIHYTSATSSGLFEQAAPGYGEIHYRLNNREEVSRITTVEGVLEAIYQVAGVTPPQDAAPAFRGHPLATPPSQAAALFYGIWPCLILLSGILIHRRLR